MVGKWVVGKIEKLEIFPSLRSFELHERRASMRRTETLGSISNSNSEKWFRIPEFCESFDIRNFSEFDFMSRDLIEE